MPRTRSAAPDDLPVVVLGDRNARYGLVVDRFLGQRELVVQPLDARLGKVKGISAAALMEDGSPILIVDVDDVVRSIETLISGGLVAKADHAPRRAAGAKAQTRILAVDDSIAVRELERKTPHRPWLPGRCGRRMAWTPGTPCVPASTIWSLPM